jgi:hypothetical protein
MPGRETRAKVSSADRQDASRAMLCREYANICREQARFRPIEDLTSLYNLAAKWERLAVVIGVCEVQRARKNSRHVSS